MNLHHLELFYYVALHAGISRAARRMPYGIQQPAISKQMADFEEYLDLRLFERQPFQLTPAGRELFAEFRPFFEKIATLKERLQSHRRPLVRLATSEFIVNEYLPDVLLRFQQRLPEARVQLRVGSLAQMQVWLDEGSADLAIAAVDRLPPGLQSHRVIQLPLVLLMPRSLPRLSPEVLWQDATLTRQFVCPPTSDGIARRFLEEIRRRGLNVSPCIETSSTAAVTAMVASGRGLGVSLDLPRLARHPKVRAIPLRDFTPIDVTVIWRAPASPAVNQLLDVIQVRARELWPEAGGSVTQG